MRLTFVNHRYAPFHGGSEIYIQKMAEFFASAGADIQVLTSNAFDLEYFWDRRARSTEAPETEVVDGIRVRRFPVHHPPLAQLIFPVSRRGMGEASRFVPWPQFYQSIATRSPKLHGLSTALTERPVPDVIVATNLGLEGPALLAQRAARRVGARFVLIPFAHIGRENDTLARRYVSMPHQRRLIREADLIIALTNLEARFLESRGADPSRIVVAGAGAEIACVTPATGASDDYRNDLPLVLSIGALARDKGTIDLVKASITLVKRGVDHELVLVGPELSEFTNWIKGTWANDRSWVRRAGIVSDEQKQALLARADVFVLVSRTESFGIVYLEAWAHRLPVVGANVGAVTEVILDGGDGILVPFGQPESIADAIQRLIGDRALARKLGEAGYDKMRSRFTWERVFERISSGFGDILGLEIHR